ncbi:MAG TPA: hypothetical protein VFI65_11115 [Streptosporangiaceae bacterium]|nr:hypothetical protein [Streptosporangiaceae bacterium]
MAPPTISVCMSQCPRRSGPAGTFRQTTDLTKPLCDIYTALAIEPPKKIISLDPAPPAS